MHVAIQLLHANYTNSIATLYSKWPKVETIYQRCHFRLEDAEWKWFSISTELCSYVLMLSINLYCSMRSIITGVEEANFHWSHSGLTSLHSCKYLESSNGSTVPIPWYFANSFSLFSLLKKIFYLQCSLQVQGWLRTPKSGGGGSKLHIDDYSQFTLGGPGGGSSLTDCTCGRPYIGNSASEGPLRVWEGDVPPLTQSAKENFTFFGGLYFFVVPV